MSANQRLASASIQGFPGVPLSESASAGCRGEVVACGSRQEDAPLFDGRVTREQFGDLRIHLLGFRPPAARNQGGSEGEVRYRGPRVQRVESSAEDRLRAFRLVHEIIHHPQILPGE